MNPSYEPPDSETRTLFGLKLQQLRNNAKIDQSVFTNIASKKKEVSNLHNNIIIVLGSLSLCYTVCRRFFFQTVLEVMVLKNFMGIINNLLCCLLLCTIDQCLESPLRCTVFFLLMYLLMQHIHVHYRSIYISISHQW